MAEGRDLQECEDGDVTGKLLNVSPIKRTKGGNQYYSGSLLPINASSALRMICFSDNLHESLQDSTRKRITMEHVKVRRDNFAGNEKLEILIKDNSSMEIVDDANGEEEVAWKTVNTILTEGMINDDTIRTKAKVLSLSGTKKVVIRNNVCDKRTATISDGTGTMDLVLWGDNGKEITQGQKLEMKNLKLDRFGGKKYVKFTAFTSYTECEDDFNIPDQDVNVRAEIVGIDHFKIVKKCYNCEENIDLDDEGNTNKAGVKCKCNTYLKIKSLETQAYCILQIAIVGGPRRSLPITSAALTAFTGANTEAAVIEALLSVDIVTLRMKDDVIIAIEL